MADKPSSEFKSLRWIVVTVVCVDLVGGKLGFWTRTADQEIAYGVLFAIFYALTEIGLVLERIATAREHS